MIEPTDADRIAAAERALRAAGIDATVEVAGHHRDIAVVRSTERDPLRVAQFTPQVRAAGFRYVTVDLAVPTAPPVADA
jgi:PP-loop superfamily ATP-utilizing enzyme